MDYYSKYIKYKTKYLNLRKQSDELKGGASVTEVKPWHKLKKLPNRNDL